jgi:hypothetical protein
MSHLQLMQAAKPIFEKNADGGVYIMTSSIAVSSPSRTYKLRLIDND